MDGNGNMEGDSVNNGNLPLLLFGNGCFSGMATFHFCIDAKDHDQTWISKPSPLQREAARCLASQLAIPFVLPAHELYTSNIIP